MTQESPPQEEEEEGSSLKDLVPPISDRERTMQTFAGLLLIVGGWSGFFLIPPQVGADPFIHRFFACSLLVLGGIFVNKKATEEWVVAVWRRLFPP